MRPPHELNLEQYRALLRDHDWFFETSNDPEVKRRGLLQRQALLCKQQVYDPACVVWNTIAPIPFRKG